jgi:hypothetical protein
VQASVAEQLAQFCFPKIGAHDRNQSCCACGSGYYILVGRAICSVLTFIVCTLTSILMLAVALVLAAFLLILVASPPALAIMPLLTHRCT